MKKMETEIKDKISLRTIYLKKLKNVSKNNYQKWNKIIFNKFNESHYFKQNNVFALYNSLPYEVETKEIIELLWKNPLIFKKTLDEIKKIINLA
ncbi:5-formyltetrahydrofolate cyclo-ligase [Spiroplasma endosymbiont of Zeiraphera isertana]|uniref:5-formyltetrahydrofolate cyclo-ligase n=1 Tax=Spiroplasma endosymbiont of Zeiraphera isertana TaxID=3066313 RepID=UPI00313E45D1